MANLVLADLLESVSDPSWIACLGERSGIELPETLSIESGFKVLESERKVEDDGVFG
jgi:hypothetical protein